MRQFRFRANVWVYDGPAPWHFVTLPKKLSAQIKKNFAGDPNRRGFGSIRVTVEVGQVRWKTSLFPDSKAGAYVLPIKAEVRKKTGLKGGTSKGFTIRVGG